MANFGDIFKKGFQTIGQTVQDIQKEEQEIADYKEQAADKGEDIITVMSKVKKIRDKHEKKRKEIADNGKSITVEHNNSDTKVEKDPKKTLVKPPKKVSQLSGKDTKPPKVSKKTKEEVVKVDKPYKTQAGDVTASSEDPGAKPTSLAIIALIGGAIGLAAYFYLR